MEIECYYCGATINTNNCGCLFDILLDVDGFPYTELKYVCKNECRKDVNNDKRYLL